MKMKLYNTLTRQKEDFDSLEPGKVKLYACGPTVYDYAHIGNLRTYIFEDTLRKTLEWLGYEVQHVMNVTDVGHLESDADTGEDKMLRGAAREQKTVWEVARYYETAFFKDTQALNIARPHVVCRATEHIEDMIDFIGALEAKGYTYTANGNVYFSIDRFPAYAQLSNMNLDQLQAGNRIDVDPHKKNPLDFVLWFTSSKFPNQVMKWASPWGVGFPGWHIECSAMSMKYLGNTIDIHCGGIDHIPIHHTNEIAQSEALTGEKWVNYWSHGEFLVVDEGKMSKSSGDFLTLSRVEQEGFSPLAYRYYCLQSRYRKQLAFHFDALTEASKGYQKLKRRIQALQAVADTSAEVSLTQTDRWLEAFSREIANDLNLPNALTVLYDVLKDKDLTAAEQLYLIEAFDRVLSLDLTKSFEIQESDTRQLAAVQLLLEKRNEARRLKQWAEADQFRKELEGLGFEVIDSQEGSHLRKLGHQA